jgi:hypothetical protein
LAQSFVGAPQVSAYGHLVLRHGRPAIETCLFGGTFVGAVTGLAWWSLVDTTRRLEECVTVGALGGAALLAFELYRAWRRAE